MGEEILNGGIEDANVLYRSISEDESLNKLAGRRYPFRLIKGRIPA